MATVFVVAIPLIFAIAVLIAGYLGHKHAEEEQNEIIEEMVELNHGHKIWCQAGPEGSTKCTCEPIPSFFTLHDVTKRCEAIRWAAIGIKR
jgi:hypothetical protein